MKSVSISRGDLLALRKLVLCLVVAHEHRIWSIQVMFVVFQSSRLTFGQIGTGNGFYEPSRLSTLFHISPLADSWREQGVQTQFPCELRQYGGHSTLCLHLTVSREKNVGRKIQSKVLGKFIR